MNFNPIYLRKYAERIHQLFQKNINQPEHVLKILLTYYLNMENPMSLQLRAYGSFQFLNGGGKESHRVRVLLQKIHQDEEDLFTLLDTLIAMFLNTASMDEELPCLLVIFFHTFYAGILSNKRTEAYMQRAPFLWECMLKAQEMDQQENTRIFEFLFDACEQSVPLLEKIKTKCRGDDLEFYQYQHNYFEILCQFAPLLPEHYITRTIHIIGKLFLWAKIPQQKKLAIFYDNLTPFNKINFLTQMLTQLQTKMMMFDTFISFLECIAPDFPAELASKILAFVLQAFLSPQPYFQEISIRILKKFPNLTRRKLSPIINNLMDTIEDYDNLLEKKLELLVSLQPLLSSADHLAIKLKILRRMPELIPSEYSGSSHKPPVLPLLLSYIMETKISFDSIQLREILFLLLDKFFRKFKNNPIYAEFVVSSYESLGEANQELLMRDYTAKSLYNPYRQLQQLQNCIKNEDMAVDDVHIPAFSIMDTLDEVDDSLKHPRDFYVPLPTLYFSEEDYIEDISLLIYKLGLLKNMQPKTYPDETKRSLEILALIQEAKAKQNEYWTTINFPCQDYSLSMQGPGG